MESEGEERRGGRTDGVGDGREKAAGAFAFFLLLVLVRGGDVLRFFLVGHVGGRVVRVYKLEWQSWDGIGS